MYALAAGWDASQINYIYATTADGNFDPSNSAYADSFLKLTTNLQLSDYFTPADQYYRWCGDLDFGSTGVMLVPDRGLLPKYANVAINAEKVDSLWVIDRTTPGGYTGTSCAKNCTTQCMNANNNVQTYSFALTPTAYSSPAYWKRWNHSLAVLSKSVWPA
jgi:hypothetical protein